MGFGVLKAKIIDFCLSPNLEVQRVFPSTLRICMCGVLYVGIEWNFYTRSMVQFCTMQ